LLQAHPEWRNKSRGVLIPVIKEIYEPVLSELESLGMFLKKFIQKINYEYETLVLTSHQIEQKLTVCYQITKIMPMKKKSSLRELCNPVFLSQRGLCLSFKIFQS